MDHCFKVKNANMFRPNRPCSRQITETMLSALKRAFSIPFNELECLNLLDPVDGGAAFLCEDLDICWEMVIRCSSISRQEDIHVYEKKHCTGS